MTALMAQWRVLRALIVRDLIIRYGRDNIGFVWVVLEPMLLCAGVTVLWSLAKQPYEHGIQVVTFIVTGYMPLTLFRHLTSPNTHILRRSLNLMLHRQIALMDVVVARAVLEFIGATLAFCVVYGFLVLIGIAHPIHNINLVVMGWLLLGWMTFGLGCCLAALTEVSESAAHFVGPIQYLSVPLSPTFYMVDWLPTSVQDLTYFNPLTHPYEMIRDGVFGPAVNAMHDWRVTFIYGLFYLATGLYGIEAVKEKLHEH